jgi:membrane protein
LIGEEGAKFIQDMIANASNPFTGTIASLTGIVVLLIGALGVFVELKNALNSMWEVELKPAKGAFQSMKRIILDRFRPSQ